MMCRVRRRAFLSYALHYVRGRPGALLCLPRAFLKRRACDQAIRCDAMPVDASCPAASSVLCRCRCPEFQQNSVDSVRCRCVPETRCRPLSTALITAYKRKWWLKRRNVPEAPKKPKKEKETKCRRKKRPPDCCLPACLAAGACCCCLAAQRLPGCLLAGWVLAGSWLGPGAPARLLVGGCLLCRCAAGRGGAPA
jgi:hypothetical protein